MKKKSCRGVTLLEVLVAVAILAVGLSTVFQVFPMGFAASSKSSYQTIAYELAARKLEESRGYSLFGGPSTADASNPEERYRYFGKLSAPNPDSTATTYEKVNTNGLFRSFSGTGLPDSKFVYKVEAYPVVDLKRKYLEFPYREGEESNSWRGFGTMYRLTVTVRGPGLTPEQASDENWPLFAETCVEAKLSTFVSNNNFGQCRLKRDYISRDLLMAKDGTKRYKFKRHKQVGANEGYNGKDLPVLRVTGMTGDYPFPEDFTVFNIKMLTAEEKQDTGPVLFFHDKYEPDTTVVVGYPGEYFDKTGDILRKVPRNADGADPENSWNGVSTSLRGEFYSMWGEFSTVSRVDSINSSSAGNFVGYGDNKLGLDNIVIFCPRQSYDYKPAGRNWYVAESNKLVDIIPPQTADNLSDDWLFVLLNDVIARDGDCMKNRTDNKPCLMDYHFDGDLQLGGKADYYPAPQTGNYGYPADTTVPGNFGQYRGTRIRYLMTLEYVE